MAENLSQYVSGIIFYSNNFFYFIYEFENRYFLSKDHFI